MSNYRIARVEKVHSDLIITASCGDEFRVFAHPIFQIQEIREEDEVLLIKISDSSDVYVYLLLRLNEDFYHAYSNMILGFTSKDTITIKAPNVVIECDKLSVTGDIDLSKGELSATSITALPGNPGLFNCRTTCPYDGKPHTTDKILIK